MCLHCASHRTTAGLISMKARSGLLTLHFTLAFSPWKIGPERTFFTVHFALDTLHFTLCISHFALCISHFAFCTSHFTFCTLRFTLCILQSIFVTLHFSLDTWYMCSSLMVFLLCYITKCDRNSIKIEILFHKMLMPQPHPQKVLRFCDPPPIKTLKTFMTPPHIHDSPSHI